MKFEKVIYKMKNKILIIEDDTDINNVIAETLTKAGYRCRQAFSGTEALLYLEMENYNLAVMDLMLPGLPGEDERKTADSGYHSVRKRQSGQ